MADYGFSNPVEGVLDEEQARIDARAAQLSGQTPKDPKIQLEDLARTSKVPVNILMAIGEVRGAKDPTQAVQYATEAAGRLSPLLLQGMAPEKALEAVLGSSANANRAILARAYQIADELYPRQAAPVQEALAAPPQIADELYPRQAAPVQEALAAPPQNDVRDVMAQAGKSVLGDAPSTLVRGAGALLAGFADALIGDVPNTAYNLLTGGDPRSKPLVGGFENPLDGIADAIQKKGAEIFDPMISDEWRQAMADSVPQAESLDPSTWNLGENPSIRGYIGQTIAVFGSLAPQIVAGIATRGASLKTQVGTAMATGAASAGGDQAQQAQATIDAMWAEKLPDGRSKLEAESMQFRAFIKDGMAPEEAYQATREEAAKAAATLAAPIGLLLGPLESKLFNPLERAVAGSGVAGRAAQVGLGAAVEGVQEATEGVAGAVGANTGAGTSENPFENTLADFVLGALGGGAAGAIGGLGGEAPMNPIAPQEPDPVSGPEPVAPPSAGALPEPPAPNADGARTFWQQPFYGDDADGNPKGPFSEAMGAAQDYGFKDPVTGATPRMGQRFTVSVNGIPTSTQFVEDTPTGPMFRFDDDGKTYIIPHSDIASGAVSFFTPGSAPGESKTTEPPAPFGKNDGGVFETQKQAAKAAKAKGLTGDAFTIIATGDGFMVQPSVPKPAAPVQPGPDFSGTKLQPETGFTPTQEVVNGVPDQESDQGSAPDGVADQGRDEARVEGVGVAPEGQDSGDSAGVSGVSDTGESGTAELVLPEPAQPLSDISDVQAVEPENVEREEEITAAPAPPTEDIADAMPSQSDDNADNRADPDPTDAQKEAGNFRMKKIRAHGLDISIETEKGQERRGKAKDGAEWSVTMPADYGYIRGTVGKDKDHIDVYVGPDPESTKVFVVDQNDLATGIFDEHKTLMGFKGQAQALNVYQDGFSDGKGSDRIGGVREFTVEKFKAELEKPARWLKPISEDYKAGVPQPSDTTAKPLTDAGLTRVKDATSAWRTERQTVRPNVDYSWIVRRRADGWNVSRQTILTNGITNPPNRPMGPFVTLEGAMDAMRSDGWVAPKPDASAEKHVPWADSQPGDRLLDGSYMVLRKAAKWIAEGVATVLGARTMLDGNSGYAVVADAPLDPQAIADAVVLTAKQRGKPEPTKPATPDPSVSDIFDSLLDELAPEIAPAVAPTATEDAPSGPVAAGPDAAPDPEAEWDSASEADRLAMLAEAGWNVGGDTSKPNEAAKRAAGRDWADLTPTARKMATGKPRTAGEALKSSAENMVSGINAALDGLLNLYGSKGTVRSGPVFDEESYQKAKPFFVTAAKHFGAAGRDVAEAMRALIKALIDKGLDRAGLIKMRAAIERFATDVRDGIIDLAQPQGGQENDGNGNQTDDSGSLDAELPGDGETSKPGVAGPTGQGPSGNVSSGNGAADADGNVGGGSMVGGSPFDADPVPGTRADQVERDPMSRTGVNPGNFIIDDLFPLGEGTEGQKLAANLAALRLMKALDDENRYPTRDEQAVMARYVGWGGLKTVFDPKHEGKTDQYGKAQAELKKLLTKEEYGAAFDSISNAHYTSRRVVQAMWRAMRHFGFSGGRALEPTVGAGNFLGLQPVDMAPATEWHGSDIDTVTGKLASYLYPDANILGGVGFQKADFLKGVFDIAIGNPPFGGEAIHDAKRPDLSGMKIHNYIIAKAGIHLRPGGVMAMVVTHRFLDTRDAEGRSQLAKDFRFIGAIRLPNNAFKENAGTEVVTDMVFLQKRRDGDEPGDQSWLDTEGTVDIGDGKTARVSKYFEVNPDHILGRSAGDGTMYGAGKGSEYTVHGDGRDVAAEVERIISEKWAGETGILGSVDDRVQGAQAMEAVSSLPIGGMMVDDKGRIMRREPDDAQGAVVKEITAETFWHDEAQAWHEAVDAIKAIRAAMRTSPGARIPDGLRNDLIYAARVVMNSKGQRPKLPEGKKPTIAAQAIYDMLDMVDNLSRPQWDNDAGLKAVEESAQRKRLGADRYARLKGMLNLRRLTLSLIRQEISDGMTVEQTRVALREAYFAFTKAHGPVNADKNDAVMQGDVGVEASLESVYEPKRGNIPEKIVLSPILSKRVNFPYRQAASAKDAEDGLHISISERGLVDLGFIASLTKSNVQAVKDDLMNRENPLVFFDPETETYEPAEVYLSGNVVRKLQMARDARLAANVEALIANQPKPKTRAQITPSVRSPWMPAKIHREFLEVLGVKNPKVAFLAGAGIWSVDGAVGALSDFGQQFENKSASILKIFSAALTGKPLKIWTKVSDGKGGVKEVVDEEATRDVNAQVDRIGVEFERWSYANSERAGVIVKAYNEKMNTHVERKYNGVRYLRIVGANVGADGIHLRNSQKNGAWRMMVSKSTLIHHQVGAGKSWTSIISVMERRRMGLSRKSMIAVPNHLVGQFSKDFYRLYPGAKILAAAPADFEKSNRRRLFARIATGDYDAVIVGHSSLKFITNPVEDETRIIEEQVEILEQTAIEAKADKSSGATLSQIRKRLTSYKERLRKLAEVTRDDLGFDFKDMGVDNFVVDECFPWETPILTRHGWLPIGRVVEWKIATDVLSFNQKTSIMEWKPIVRWLTMPSQRPLVKVHHERGYVTCTPDHKFLTVERGYVEAEALLSSDTLRVMRGGVYPARAASEDVSDLLSGGKTLSSVRGGVHVQEPWRGERRPPEILRDGLCSEVEDGATRQEGAPVSRHEGQAFATQGAEEPQNEGLLVGEPSSPSDGGREATHVGGAQGEALDWDAWRKRKGTIATAEVDCDSAVSADGVYPEDWATADAIPLADRHCLPGHKAGRGDRWEITSIHGSEGQGSEEGRDTVFSRVELVEVLEPDGGRGTGSGNQGHQAVYDIEVEGNHNFFAAGVLVKNCHEFKNLEYQTGAARLVGMNDPKGSQRAFDLFIKTQGLLSRGGAASLMSGTPISNSLVEIYAMLKYLSWNELKNMGLAAFDAWSGAFVHAETRYEYTATQKLVERRVLSKLVNLSALSQLYRSVADVMLQKDVRQVYKEQIEEENRRDGTNKRTEWPVPKVKTGGRVLLQADASPDQQEFTDYLVMRMHGIKTASDKKAYAKIDNALWVLTDARKASIDVRTVDPTLERAAESKVVRAGNEVKRIYDAWAADRGTQLVFSDMSTPSGNAAKEARRFVVAALVMGGMSEASAKAKVKAQIEAKMRWTNMWSEAVVAIWEQIESDVTDPGDAERMQTWLEHDDQADAEPSMAVADTGFSVYDDMRKYLVELGIPLEEIAFIHDYTTDEAKLALYADVNAGRIRVLFGSTPKLGAGTNVQQRLVALHHLDAPWRPSDIEQREGRIIRQGNIFYERDPEGFEVEIIAYSTNGTSDVVLWQGLERKSRGIETFLNDAADVVEDESGDADQYEMFMAQSTGNPVYLLKLQTEKAVTTAWAEISGRLVGKADAERFLSYYDQQRERLQKISDALGAADTTTLRGIDATGKAINADLSTLVPAMEAADAEYRAAETKYIEEGAAIEEAKAKGVPVKDRPKRTIEKPHRPTMWTPSVIEASPYAALLHENLKTIAGMRIDKYASDDQRTVQVEFRLGAWKMVIVKSRVWHDETGRLHRFIAYLSVPGLKSSGADYEIDLSNSEGLDPLGSSRLLSALHPESILERIRNVQGEARQRLEKLEAELPVMQERAALDVDRNDYEDLTRASVFYSAAVSLAEMTKEAGRVGKVNRFAQMDAKRNLRGASENTAITGSVSFTDPLLGEFTSEGTGVMLGKTTSIGAIAVQEAWAAKRVSDGHDAIIFTQAPRAKQEGRDASERTPVAVILDPRGPEGRGKIKEKRAANDFDLEREPTQNELVELRRSLIAELKRMGLDFLTLKLASQFRTETGAPAWGYFMASTRTVGAGWDNSIGALGILRHEAIHALRASAIWNAPYGAFTRQEWQTLVGAARKNKRLMERAARDYSELPFAGQVEEAIADMFIDWSAKQDTGGPLSAIFQKISNVFEAIINALKGNGFATSAAVFEAIRSGGLAARAADADPILGSGLLSDTEVAEVMRLRKPITHEYEQGLINQLLTQAMSGGARSILGLVPGRPLFTELGTAIPSAKSYQKLKDAMDRLRTQWQERTDAVAKDWRYALVKNGKANIRLMDLMHDSTIAGQDPSEVYISAASPEDYEAVRTMNGTPRELVDATRRIKKDRERKAQYADLKKRFDDLPKAFRKMYGTVRDEYTAMADAYEKAIIDNIAKAGQINIRRAERAYADEMKRMDDDGLIGGERTHAMEAAQKKLDRVKRELGAGSRARQFALRKQFESNRVQGPYFPLTRFGSFFVTVRDQNGKVVSFSLYETVRSRDKAATEAAAEPNQTVHTGVLSDGSLRAMVDPTFVADVEHILSGINAPKSVMDAIWQKWLETLPELSVRRNRIHRKATPGYSSDAFRAFGKHAFHGSHQIARITYALDLQDSLVEARREADRSKDPTRNGLIVDEMDRRMAYMMNPQGSWFSQALTTASFLYFMAFSPSAALVNVSQTTVVGIPVLASMEGGSYRQATGQITRAMLDFTRGRGHAVESGRLTDDEKDAMHWAYETGLIDRSMAHDLAGVEAHGVEFRDTTSKFMAAAAWMLHQTERLNREVTFLAAYRVAKINGDVPVSGPNGGPPMASAAAMNKAAKATWKTHFSYQNNDRPRITQGNVARVIFTMKTFQINMLWRLFRDTHQMFKGETPAVRREARKVLFGITASMMLHAGISGTWLFGMATMIASLFAEGDDDDMKDEFKTAVVEIFGPRIGSAMFYGLPQALTGISISPRIGMPDLWFRDETRAAEGEALYQQWVAQAIGAIPSIIENQLVGLQMIGEGRIERGLETMAPKPVRDLMKGVRYMSEGALTKNGDPLVDEVSTYQVIVQALGFTPAEIAEQSTANSLLYDRQTVISDEKSALMKDLAETIMAGGRLTPDQLGAVQDFNAAHPGYSITADGLKSSVRTRTVNHLRNEGGALLIQGLDEELRESLSPFVFSKQ